MLRSGGPEEELLSRVRIHVLLGVFEEGRGVGGFDSDGESLSVECLNFGRRDAFRAESWFWESKRGFLAEVSFWGLEEGPFSLERSVA